MGLDYQYIKQNFCSGRADVSVNGRFARRDSCSRCYRSAGWISRSERGDRRSSLHERVRIRVERKALDGGRITVTRPELVRLAQIAVVQFERVYRLASAEIDPAI